MGRKTTFKRTVFAHAVLLAIAATVSTGAMAQSNATGSLSGTVDMVPGTSVVLTSKETGARRVLTPDASGRFSATSVVTGSYKAEALVNGKVVKTLDDVEVRVGQGTDVSLGTQLKTVTVVGSAKKIEMASMGSTTVFTASDLAKVPVASNVGAVIQLAPNTTRGDSRFGGGNAPSFGGSSSSENAYYINGFPVTTLLTQVGFSQLPFNSISQAQVLTGGYGAEFGRSTGGVVNIVTKSGTNQWVAGAAYSITPNSLRSTPKNIYYENNGTALDGKLRFYNEANEQTDQSVSGYIGGALIPDKLFMFFSGEQTKNVLSNNRTANTAASGSVSTSSWQERTVQTPRYLLKLDWNITDAHHLEYTRISDKVQDSRSYYGFNFSTLKRNTVSGGGADYLNWGPTPVASQQGAEVDILKYTGYLTDDLTLTAVMGQTKTPHELNPVGYNPALAQVIAPTGNTPASLGVVPILQSTTANQLVPGALDTNKGARLDVEWKATRAHTVRIGLEKNTINSVAGSSTAGGVIWNYLKTDPLLKPNQQTNPTGSIAGNPLAQQGYYVQRIVSATQSTPTVDQSAQYIEDRWQVTDRVLLSLGLRNEGFNNKNGDGKSYIDLPTQLAPRFGATWDARGDASLKLFANVGRYHVPLPTNVAVRGAGSSLNAQTDYVYTGIDANGAPTGLTAISPFYSNNNELGQAKDPREVAAQDMKGNYQDELAFGFEQAFSKNLNIGAKFTYRTLRTAIDDHCDDRPLYAWAARNNVDTTNFHGYNCALFNPGEDNTFNIDMNGDGKLESVKLTAKELGFPAVDRKYMALDLYAEHPFDGTWYGKATYTFAKNEGNFEGQLLSDIGQADVSTSQAFDFPEFHVNSSGPLPNQRNHQIKLFGFYQLTPEWGVGGNFLWASGRPRNCIGNAPDPTGSDAPYVDGGKVTNYSGYGSAYFFCNGVASPRGSLGELDADMKLDLNFAYKPSALKGFGLKVDVFNVFNRQSVEAVEERRHARGSSVVNTTYGIVQSYTAPRAVKLTASYDYKF
jgi:outer membrane receptor protein involved in Fe transport